MFGCIFRGTLFKTLSISRDIVGWHGADVSVVDTLHLLLGMRLSVLVTRYSIGRLHAVIGESGHQGLARRFSDHIDMIRLWQLLRSLLLLLLLLRV